MTTVINLFGGPGIGKSTFAAQIFFKMKLAQISCELVTEYVKQWAWEDRKPVTYDQFYFFGKQVRKEYTLYNKVDFIITDSSAPIVAYYAKVYGTDNLAHCFQNMTKEFYKMGEDRNIKYINIFLEREPGTYKKEGRFNTEEEAITIDKDMKTYFNSTGIEFVSIPANLISVNKFIEEYLT